MHFRANQRNLHRPDDGKEPMTPASRIFKMRFKGEKTMQRSSLREMDAILRYTALPEARLASPHSMLAREAGTPPAST